tara:strand:- start:5979 stop:6224 length:246 start_codon:yes stop_codon:yes gene_type:complete
MDSQLNSYLYSSVITICYLLINIIEMRFLNNETKPLKELFKNSLLVFFSSLCGIYILSNMNSNSLKPAKQSTEIFTGTPEF